MSFGREYQALLDKKNVSHKSSILSLHPFLDKNGILRVEGRLGNSTLTYGQKHPIIIPKNGHLTTLLVRDAQKIQLRVV